MDLVGLKEDMARFVSANLVRFVDTGRRLDEEYSVAAYRKRRASDLRAERRNVDRRATRERWVSGTPDTSSPIATAIEGGGAVLATPGYMAYRLDVLDFPFRRHAKPSARQKQWHLRSHGLPDNVLLPEFNPERFGLIESRPLQRLGEAVSSIPELEDDMGVDAARRALLLLWLLEQRNANELDPVVCEFQRLPWEAWSVVDGNNWSGRELLVAFQRSYPEKVCRRALGIARQDPFCSHRDPSPWLFVPTLGEIRAAIRDELKGADRRLPEAPDPAAAHSLAAQPHDDSNRCCMIRNGQFWVTTFDGSEAIVPDSAGMIFILKLLAQPGRALGVEELLGAPAKPEAKQPVMDKKYVAEMLQKKAQLNAQFNELTGSGSEVEATEVGAELEKVSAELSANTTGGYRRRSFPDDGEANRSRVGKAIGRALRDIARDHPALGTHLRESIHAPTGHSPCYRPAEPHQWILNP